VVTRSVQTNERADEQTNAADRQTENMMPLPTLLGGKNIKTTVITTYVNPIQWCTQNFRQELHLF